MNIIDRKDNEFTSEEVALYEQKYAAAFKKLAELTLARKKLEAEDAKIREQIEKSMDEFNIRSIDNDHVLITRVEANPGKPSLDLDALKKAEPDTYAGLLEDYPITSVDVEAFKKAEPEDYADILKDFQKITGKKKAYVTFKVKDK